MTLGLALAATQPEVALDAVEKARISAADSEVAVQEVGEATSSQFIGQSRHSFVRQSPQVSHGCSPLDCFSVPQTAKNLYIAL